MEKDDIRVELNDENKTIGAKIREATLHKVPYMVIIGEKEIENSVMLNEVKHPSRMRENFSNKLRDSSSSTQNDKMFVSVRTREGKDLGLMNLYEFIKKLKSQIETFL